MGKIINYTLRGEIKSELPLNEKYLDNIHGKLVRCHMVDGTHIVGFGDPYRTRFDFDNKIHDIIYLWTWDHLDETTGQLIGEGDEKYNQTFTPVKIDQIKDIEAILFSNPRWGGRLTNKFFIKSDYDLEIN